MEYHIEILTKDFSKKILFTENGSTEIGWGVPSAWEDYKYAMGAVIDDKITPSIEGNVCKAVLSVPDMRYDDVLDIMCEDLSQPLIKVLTDNQKVSYFELHSQPTLQMV
ncbi:MAG: hypothetical protein NZ551_11115 [Microscillaceae bacterium]|nr:hypothetical protein [Microscillaceae bacterium]MDW8461747.1 hypothetical protein [Cytophagales bacterium]